MSRLKLHTIFLMIASAAAAVSTSASAQQWTRWAEPLRDLSPSDARDGYDDSTGDREDAPRRWRYDNRYGDDREMYESEDAERRYRARHERGLDREQEQEQDDEWRDNEARRFPDADTSETRKPEGVDGGSRPDIQPVAPPRVAFSGYAPGSIVIDTGSRKLYFVTGLTSAYAYPIGVGREGFAWTGSEKVSRIADWPDWYPPEEMRQRKPELPERMLGGLNNPLGAKAIYLGNTLYRIHGTNDPKSIGKAESSGCFRMLNQHVLHLASLVNVGTPVTVVRTLGAPRLVAKSVTAPSSQLASERPATPRHRYSYGEGDDFRPGWQRRRYFDDYGDDR